MTTKDIMEEIKAKAATSKSASLHVWEIREIINRNAERLDAALALLELVEKERYYYINFSPGYTLLYSAEDSGEWDVQRDDDCLFSGSLPAAITFIKENVQ